MAAPRRMTLTNLETGEPFEVQYNPTGVEVQLEAMYSRVASPGASFQEMQYSGTGNTKITFDLAYDGRAADAPAFDLVEGFMLSLLYPPEKPLGPKNGSPPRVLFTWPGWISLVVKKPKFSESVKRFSPDGPPTYVVWKVELEESRVTRLGTEGVRRSVLRRAA